MKGNPVRVAAFEGGARKRGHLVAALQRGYRRFAQVAGIRAAVFLALASACSAAEASLTERPFAPRSGPGSATLFTELPSAQTGIVTENNYDDPRMWWERYREFLLGAIGTGIAVGDYDADGRSDVFVVSKTGGHRLFRNQGDWRFEDVTLRAGVATAPGEWAQGATFADVNNDGHPDLYVCRFSAPNLLYLNRGDGTFVEAAAAAGLAVHDASAMASFADYDRDGWLDVYVLTNALDFNHDREGRPDFLFRNNGDGTFTDVTTAAGIAGKGQGHSATWWDYDGDGWLDLYVANDFVPADALYRNNRNGTFTVTLSRALPHTPNSSMGADVGDLDNDGRLDLLVADMAATTHEKDQRGMVEGRDESLEWPDDPAIARQVPRGALFLNTGTDRCLEAAQLAGLAATDWTWSVRCEDFDNDGRLDVHVTTGMVRELHNSDLIARSNRTSSPQERVRVIRSSPVFAERNLAFRNLGDLEFAETGAAWGLDQMGVSFAAATGDFDGDGDLDLVLSNFQAGVTVLRNDSGSGHRVTFALRGTASSRDGVGATVRIETASGSQVRALTPARGYLASNEPLLHFGLGADDRLKRVIVTWPSRQVQTWSDLAVDRHYTITEPPESGVSADVSDLMRHKSTAGAPVQAPAPPHPTRFTELAGAVNLAFTAREDPLDETIGQALLPRRFNRAGPAIALGDLDGDGIEDVCFGGTTRDAARTLLATPTGRYHDSDSLLPFARSTLNDGPLLIIDADGDGRNDLLLTRGGVAAPAGAPDYQPELLLNAGRALFQRAAADALPSLPVCVGTAAAADFDRDGRLDVFLGGRVIPGQYPLPPDSALLMNRGGGRFEDVTDALAPGLRTVGMVTSALWTDVDGDGWLDLLTTLEWGGVRFLRNQEGRAFEDRSEAAGFAAAGTGWWSSLAAADFNGDGQPDYVAGNAGLNTPYRATPPHPAVLFRGVFEEGGAPQLIEAWYEGDRLVPRRGRKQLGAVIPSVAKRFQKSDDYARKTLGEILGDDALAAAQRFAATELRSGVFLSQPDRTFRFVPLPRLAQIAPLQGIVAGDFDGDGRADIYALQNSHAPIPPVGRFDGGLSQFLRGDGHGNFSLVPPAENGLVVSGDARALAVFDADRDGWPDFLATRSREDSLTWRNPGAPGRAMLRVELRGPHGNPTGIGARVTLTLADGTTQTSDVHAGSGHLTQSTAALFFGHSEANPPRAVHVRWPSGELTTEKLDAPGPHLILRAPLAP